MGAQLSGGRFGNWEESEIFFPQGVGVGQGYDHKWGRWRLSAEAETEAEGIGTFVGIGTEAIGGGGLW